MCFLLHNNQTMGRGSKDQYCLLFSQVLRSCISVSSLEWPPLFFRSSQGMVGKRWPKLLFDEFCVPTPSQFSTIAKYLCRDIFAYRPMLKWTSSGWMPYPLCPLTKTRRSCGNNCDSLPPVPPVSIQTNDMSSFLTYFILSCFCILCCTHPRFVVYFILSLKICPLDLLYT